MHGEKEEMIYRSSNLQQLATNVYSSGKFRQEKRLSELK